MPNHRKGQDFGHRNTKIEYTDSDEYGNNYNNDVMVKHNDSANLNKSGESHDDDAYNDDDDDDDDIELPNGDDDALENQNPKKESIH